MNHPLQGTGAGFGKHLGEKLDAEKTGIHLTQEDWKFIHWGLKVAFDEARTDDQERRATAIMEIIGPDGETAAAQGVEAV